MEEQTTPKLGFAELRPCQAGVLCEDIGLGCGGRTLHDLVLGLFVGVSFLEDSEEALRSEISFWASLSWVFCLLFIACNVPASYYPG